MSYTINNLQFIWVKFEETHSAKAVENFIQDIMVQFPREQWDRVMVDTRDAEVDDKIYSITNVMGSFQKLGVPKEIKIAVLRNATSGAGKYHEMMKSVVTAEGYNFTLFDDYERAILWLHI